VTYRTSKVRPTVKGEHDVYHRHGLLQGFDQARLDDLGVVLVGGGGLGSEIGISLVKKGVGRLDIFDDDVVTLTNLPRQFYFRKDLFKPKAIRLARNLSKLATNDSIITGYPIQIQEAVEKGLVPDCDVVIVGVDNADARFFCSEHFYDKVPVIFTAVSPEADAGYVFVQEPGKACFGCVFPDEHGRPARKCSGSTIDINKAIAGIVSYAVDTLCMKRPRNWNYKRIFLSGLMGDLSEMVERDPECAFCRERGAA
jgi:molybdopterin/thiamine biosynthesis adenylyltransferase